METDQLSPDEDAETDMTAFKRIRFDRSLADLSFEDLAALIDESRIRNLGAVMSCRQSSIKWAGHRFIGQGELYSSVGRVLVKLKLSIEICVPFLLPV